MSMPDNTSPIVELENVSKRYRSKVRFLGREARDVVALDGISFAIYPGEIFGLVGQSGSGKTTSGRLIAKLENPDAGVVRLEGQDVSGLRGAALKRYRRKVQMIFQDPYQSLNPYLSVLQAIMEPLIIHDIGTRGDRLAEVERRMQAVGLTPPDDFLNRYPHQLSGGERQRVAIARTMVLKPEFIIADEPTSMLDATIAIQLFNILLDIRRRWKVAFLFVTHNLGAARFLCDRIAVIRKGVIVESGATTDVIQNPRHAYTQALIAAQPGFAYRGSDDGLYGQNEHRLHGQVDDKCGPDAAAADSEQTQER